MQYYVCSFYPIEFYQKVCSSSLMHEQKAVCRMHICLKTHAMHVQRIPLFLLFKDRNDITIRACATP